MSKSKKISQFKNSITFKHNASFNIKREINLILILTIKSKLYVSVTVSINLFFFQPTTCMDMQATQQQRKFNFNTAVLNFLTIFADIKSYRAALYSFRINVINADPTLLDKRLPFSLIPRKPLIKMLDSVHGNQRNAPDLLTLAKPITDILLYYDEKLVQEISIVEDRLLLTLAMAIASSQTVFEFYCSNIIPLPQMDFVDAIQWVSEGEHLAILVSTNPQASPCHYCIEIV